MSKMKELDHIADCVVDIISEHLDHNIAWAIDDTIVDDLNGDDFTDAIPVSYTHLTLPTTPYV